MGFFTPFVFRQGFVSVTPTGCTFDDLLTIDGYDAIVWLSSDGGCSGSTVFIDNGVTSATTNDDVYLWKDETSYLNNAIQSSPGDRPTFLTGDTCFNGENILSFNDSEGDFMEIADDSSFSTLTEMTMFTYFKANDTFSPGSDVIVQYSDDSISGGQADGWTLDRQSNLGVEYLRFVYDDDTVSPSGYHELEIPYDYTNCNLVTIRLSGNTIDMWTGTTKVSTSTDGDGMDTPAGGEPMTIAANFSGTLLSPLDFGSYVLYNGPLSDSGVTSVQNYFLSKYNQSQPSLTDLVMWTKSEDGITESGGFISEWADQTGNNNDFDNTTAGKPFYNTTGTTFGGLPYIEFNDTNEWWYMDTITSSDLITPNGFTLYLVSAIQDLPHSKSFLLHKTSLGTTWQDGWGILSTSSTNIRFYVNAEFFLDTGEQVNLTVPSGLTSNGDPHIFKLRYDKNNVEAEIIGPVANVSGSTPYTDNVIDSGDGIWLSYQTTSFNITQDVGEFLFYNTAISSEQQTATENYLKSKYGIS